MKPNIKLIILITTLCIAMSANAQVGIVLGLNSSASKIDEAAQKINKVNKYHAGLTVKIPLIGNFLALQPSLIYRVGGSSIDALGKGQNAKLDFKNGYLQLPVQLQAGLGLGSVVRLYGIAEPFLGYQFGVNKTELSVGEVASYIDYGLGLGAGVELFRHLQVSVRYIWEMGYLKGPAVNINKVGEQIKSGKATGGIAASIAFIF